MKRIEFSRLRTCVIADDNVDYCNALCEFMSRVGLECQTAYDGEQAWRKIVAQPPDIVITDMDMPRLCGLDLLGRCRAANLHFFVILISGRPESIEVQRIALKDCCAALLGKPVRARALLDCLHAADAQDHYHACVHVK